jgi:hypothetical protein
MSLGAGLEGKKTELSNSLFNDYFQEQQQRI